MRLWVAHQDLIDPRWCADLDLAQLFCMLVSEALEYSRRIPNSNRLQPNQEWALMLKLIVKELMRVHSAEPTAAHSSTNSLDDHRSRFNADGLS